MAKFLGKPKVKIPPHHRVLDGVQTFVCSVCGNETFMPLDRTVGSDPLGNKICSYCEQEEKENEE